MYGMVKYGLGICLDRPRGAMLCYAAALLFATLCHRRPTLDSFCTKVACDVMPTSNIVTAMGIVAKRRALFSKHLTSVINQPHIQAWLCNYRLSVTSTRHNKHTIQHNEQIHAGNQSIIILKVTNYTGCPISMQTHRVSSDPPRTDVMN